MEGVDIRKLVREELLNIFSNIELEEERKRVKSLEKRIAEVTEDNRELIAWKIKVQSLLR